MSHAIVLYPAYAVRIVGSVRASTDRLSGKSRREIRHFSHADARRIASLDNVTVVDLSDPDAFKTARRRAHEIANAKGPYGCDPFIWLNNRELASLTER